KLTSEYVEKIFNEKKYSGWRPQVLDNTDILGNRLVKLESINATKPLIDLEIPSLHSDV
ncbi:MAG: hypothetical protein K940chlam6_01642, partial [Chlamydiae bacterium]|nr:hypothetical protein [Chlamydiota bacterium]